MSTSLEQGIIFIVAEDYRRAVWWCEQRNININGGRVSFVSRWYDLPRKFAAGDRLVLLDHWWNGKFSRDVEIIEAAIAHLEFSIPGFRVEREITQ
jgi:hypothetical protein